jgi:hypothetical protein
MEEIVEARVPPSRVWEAWEKAHAVNGSAKIVEGFKGKTQTEGKKGFRYRVLNVDPGKSFSILWKTLFVRLLFHHSVHPTKRGSEIRYSFEIKGLFALPVRWLLGNKIRSNLSLVLKAIVRQLEEEAGTR